MRKFADGAFGSGFVPGKVKEDVNVVAQALGHRWSGMPASDATGRVGERPPGTASPDSTGTSTWTTV